MLHEQTTPSGIVSIAREARGQASKGLEGEVELVPAGRARRFGVDRRPSSPALRGLGAKAILVDADERAPLPFDVLESKLLVPPGRSQNVSRTALVNRLRAAGAFPVVLVTAPAGYGKTTLLAQWAERDARPFAWVTVDERDNDAFVLLKHIAAAVDWIEPLGAGVLDAFDRPNHTIWDALAPRLSATLSSRTSPSVLVLDGVDALESTDSLEAIGILIGSIPRGSMIALSGRSLPEGADRPLRVAGPLLEIGDVRARAQPPRGRAHAPRLRRRAGRGRDDRAHAPD